MAKVTQPLGSGEARGSVGGYTYGTWRGFNVVRSRVTPKNEFGGIRPATQAIMSAVAPGWGLLTQDQRQAWADFAAQHVEVDWTGTDIQLPAYNWWIRIQCIIAHDSLAPQTDPPTIDQSMSIRITSALPVVHAIVVYWDNSDTDLEDQYIVELWKSGPHSPGRRPTLHDAHWEGCSNASDNSAYSPCFATGAYTFFLRPVTRDGFPCGWQQITASL
jgi:hypothetical protein